MSPLPPDLENKNASLVEKRNAIAKRLSEVEGKNEQKSKIIEKIEMVRVEQAKKKKCRLFSVNGK